MSVESKILSQLLKPKTAHAIQISAKFQNFNKTLIPEQWRGLFAPLSRSKEVFENYWKPREWQYDLNQLRKKTYPFIRKQWKVPAHWLNHQVCSNSIISTIFIFKWSMYHPILNFLRFWCSRLKTIDSEAWEDLTKILVVSKSKWNYSLLILCWIWN